MPISSFYTFFLFYSTEITLFSNAFHPKRFFFKSPWRPICFDRVEKKQKNKINKKIKTKTR